MVKKKTSKKLKSTGKNTKKKRRLLTIDYDALFDGELRDLDYAAGYLTVALEEGVDVFLMAVRDVARVHCGISGLAKATELNRENLYDMLSKDGNPRLSSIASVIDKLGLEISFRRKGQSNKVA